MGYGGTLPKTGAAGLALAVGGHTFNAPMPLIIAAAGLGIVALGATIVRFGFRRTKTAGQA
jgi:hypothetical protein